jgi:hypothetical protein
MYNLPNCYIEEWYPISTQHPKQILNSGNFPNVLNIEYELWIGSANKSSICCYFNA